jgi:energy-converting hydrogenase Eha subunit A
MACWLPPTPLLLSVMVTVPLRVPVVVGVKVTVIQQLPPAATDAPQLFVWAKSSVATMLETKRGPVPVLLRYTNCGGLVLPLY